MTRDEAVAQVQIGLGLHTQHAERIATMLQQRQQALERGVLYPQGQGTFFPWFLETHEEISTSAGTLVEGGGISLPLPAGWLAEAETTPLQLRTDYPDEPDAPGWKPLDKRRVEWLQRAYHTPGPPRGYAVRPTSLFVMPEPDSQGPYTVRTWFFKADSVLAAGNDTNLWLTHVPYLLIGQAGEMMAMGTGAAERVQYFRSMATEAALQLRSYSVQRDTDNTVLQMGGPL